jgi:drug/metabolite transporter (DMT)-like permease
MSSSGNGAVLLGLVSSVLYAAGLVFMRLGLHHMAPVRGTLFSIPSATLLFWLLCPFLLDVAGFDLAATAVFALIGLFFPVVGTLLMSTANRRVGPTIAGTVSSTAPFLAILGAWLLLGERPTPGSLLGACGVVAGVAALAWDSRAAHHRWALWTLALPLSVALIRALGQTLSKLGLELWANPFAAALIGYSVSSGVVIAANAAVRPGAGPDSVARGAPWFALAGVSNGLAVLTMYFALTKGPVALVSTLVATHPLFVLLLSRVFLGQRSVGPGVPVAVALTVAGVALLVSGR